MRAAAFILEWISSYPERPDLALNIVQLFLKLPLFLEYYIYIYISGI